jgi:hypothetical protein
MLTSHDKIKQNDSILNNSWEQPLASPLSITSAQHINSTHLQQNIISTSSSKQLSLNETKSDFNYDNYSQHQMSPSTSFLIETNGKSFKSIYFVHIFDSFRKHFSNERDQRATKCRRREK